MVKWYHVRILHEFIEEVKHMPRNFRGGVHPDDMKKLSKDKAIETLPAPSEVVLPVSMHIGAPAVPVVAVGDTVKIGDPIADGAAGILAILLVYREFGKMRMQESCS